MNKSGFILKFHNVTKSFKSGSTSVTALEKISLNLRPGDTVALVGPSGSGKSTLLALAAGLETPDSGTVHLQDLELGKLSEDERALLRNRVIGFVYQNFQLLPTLTALENCTLPLELLGEMPYAEARRRGLEMLEQVGLANRAAHYPAQLSGGEQQRVGLARTFSTRPSILLADEPTGSLDRANAEIAIRLMMELNAQHNSSILMVTHDPEAASRMSVQVHLRDGRMETSVSTQGEERM